MRNQQRESGEYYGYIAYVVELDLLNGRVLRVRIGLTLELALLSVRVLLSIASTTQEYQALLRHIHRLASILDMSCRERYRTFTMPA